MVNVNYAKMWEFYQQGFMVDLVLRSTSGTSYKVHGIVMEQYFHVPDDAAQEDDGCFHCQTDNSDQFLTEIIKHCYGGYGGNPAINHDNLEEFKRFAFKFQDEAVQVLVDRFEASNRIRTKHLRIIGGNDVYGSSTGIIEVLNPETEEWESEASSTLCLGGSPLDTIASHGSEVIGNTIYVVGGHSSRSGFSEKLYQYDLNTNEWRQLSAMDKARGYLNLATVVLQDKLFALGGQDDDDRSVEVYDPVTNQWDDAPDMPFQRSEFAAVAYQGTILCIGGFDGQDHLSSIEQFNPATGVWTTITNMTTARSGCSAIAVGDKVFIIGGYDGTELLSSVECLSLGFDGAIRWHQVPPMSIARSFFTVSSRSSSEILVIGGYRDRDDPAFHDEGRVCGYVEALMIGEEGFQWRSMNQIRVARYGLSSVYA